MAELDLSPITRIEGHLDFKINVENGVVTDAKAIGALFRGFELILKGRDPLDALVITPRICGVCPTSHNDASARALDNALNASIPENGYLMRSILLGTENLMSHAAHMYVLFGPDLANKKYEGHEAYPELVKRFAPITGTSYKGAVFARIKLDEIFAIFGGKHPHTTFVPGGAPVRPQLNDITRALSIFMQVQDFLENTTLGCSVERWLENKSLKDVVSWLEEDEKHANSDLGLFIRFGTELGFHKLGPGPGNFLSYGVYAQADGKNWLPAGFYDGKHHSLDQSKIEEHIRYSWYTGYEGGRHPSEGVTEPYYEEGEKYTWAKCPRYQGMPVEVGPLARMIIDKDPVVLDLAKEYGPCVYTRVLARLHEAVRLAAKIKEWLLELDPGKPFFGSYDKVSNAEGIGLTEAARGALGHWIKIRNGRIDNYQVITPTAWNVSPKDSNDVHGPIEQAVIGTPVEDENNPIEVQHVIRSYDPCIACTVHVITPKKSYHLKVV